MPRLDDPRGDEGFRALFEALPEALLIIAPGGAITMANAVADELFGYPAGALEGRSIAALVPQLPPDLHAVAGRRELRAVRRDGAALTVEVSLRSLPPGSAVVVMAVHDVTAWKQRRDALEERIVAQTSELRENEARLTRARDVALAASRAKSAFLANMSHEIRTPMNAVLGYTQLLQRDVRLTQGQHDYLEVIRRSGEHLLNVINDVLDISKIEAGHHQVARDVIDLRAVLDDLARMFRLRAEAKRLSFEIHRAADVPRQIVADEGKLRQVLVNLLSNAVKFTEAGGVVARVRVGPLSGGAGGTWLSVEIEDTGPGIGSDEMASLFEPFTQLRKGAGAPGGTGLGLSLSRELVRLMGGDIGVESGPGKGTVFRLRVPVEIGIASVEARARPRAVRAIGIAGQRPPPRVLLADDDDDNRGWLSRLLVEVGFDVREASDGRQAMVDFESFRPDLVLMDMSMPVMSGYAAVRAIRAQPGGRRVAIVAVTASAFDEARDAIFEAGADGWLRKPCREDEILDEIQRHLGITYRYAARRTSTPGMAAVTGRPSAFGSLPPALTTEICNAAHLADYQRLTELIAELRGEHAAAAEALHRLTEAFAYEQIESQAKQGQVREEPSTTENAAVVGYPTGVGASSNPAPRR